MSESRTYYLVKRNRRRSFIKGVTTAIFVAGCILALSFGVMLFSAVNTSARQPDTGGYEKMYKSVIVDSGECLWDIADEYMGVGYTDKRTYVEEIRQINGLNGSEIHPGQYICVPYYA